MARQQDYLSKHYPVKYVDIIAPKTGKVKKEPFYLLNGEWVDRWKCPEVKEHYRKYRIKNRERHNRLQRERYWKDLENQRARCRIWRSNNKAKAREVETTYRSGERGHFMELWNGIKKSKHGHHFKNFDDFYQCWLDQKAIYGMKCPATGETMTMLKRAGTGGTRRNTPTNISRDRILCSRGYSKQNLIFTTWAFNNSKNNLSPKGAKAFLRIVKERYGTDEVE
tara:strand:- start:23 stop:694 length:672 start_codon:yes stop_codon:yes gene_type:complete